MLQNTFFIYYIESLRMFLLRLSFDFANTNTLTSLSAFGLEHRFSSAHTFYLFLYLFFKFALIVVLPLQIAGLNMLQIMVSVCVIIFWQVFVHCNRNVNAQPQHERTKAASTVCLFFSPSLLWFGSGFSTVLLYAKSMAPLRDLIFVIKL